MVIMTSGMAHVSGGIMAMYISQGVEARHLLSAVIMTSPGTILMAKMLVPETEVPATEGKVVIPKDELHADENFIGAIARGTIDGGKLAMNVGIMLISFLALVALLDMMLSWIARHAVHALGSGLARADSGIRVCARGVAHRRAVARLHGDRQPAGHAHGAQRSHRLHPAWPAARRANSIADRSFTIATFALCGFANLGSIGMQIGGIGALVPERRNDLAKLGVRAMLAGTMANLISASIAGIFLG